MVGLGTIVNVGAIISGGLLGMVVGKKLKERFQKTLIASIALCLVAISISGLVSKMIEIKDGVIVTKGTYVLLGSLILGAIVGEILDVDGKIEIFGAWLKQKTGNSKDPIFIEGFVTASLTVCIGAMAIVGSIEDGINHDYTLLFAKSAIDFVFILVLSSTLGKGCLFSAIPVAIVQGIITFFAMICGSFLTAAAIDNISLVGSALIMCVGVNMFLNDKHRIKVANLIPAVIFAAVISFFF